MIIQDFINEYNEKKDGAERLAYVRSHLSEPYVPVLTKMATIRQMLDGSIVRGTSVYMDSVNCYILHSLALVALYTDLTPGEPQTDGQKQVLMICGAYDQLKSSGALDQIISAVAPEELEEFNRIFSMTASDMERDVCSQTAQWKETARNWAALLRQSLLPLAGSFLNQAEAANPELSENPEFMRLKEALGQIAH